MRGTGNYAASPPGAPGSSPARAFPPRTMADASAVPGWSPALLAPVCSVARSPYSSGTISNATMLMILISGLMAGPAVSL